MQQSQLISPGELARKSEHEDWRIIDCRFHLADPSRGRQEYEAGHIPGAVFMDLNQDLASPPNSTSGRHPLPDVGTIAATMGRLGIHNGSNVVVYDADVGAMAARCWWILRWLGHGTVRLLDGGLAAWLHAGLPLSAEIPTPQATKFVPSMRGGAVITTDELAALVGTADSPKILDARDANRFAGISEPIDPVAGHVPGAENLPFMASLRPDGRWKGRMELEALWQRYLGDDTQTAWVAMCGSGVTACHLALSAFEAGYSEPQLYAGSWSEWIQEESRPIATGSA
jgi:thiosulfate/3-mercaptopyruvate sulfurtransferase